MRHARWTAALLVLASACSSFGSNDSTDPSGSDAGDMLDAAAPADADAGRPAPGAVVTVLKEGDVARGVAVTRERIYWWSVQNARISSVSKDDLGTVKTIVDRKGQTVTAVGADSGGVYWLEAGPDAEEGGTSDRIMKKEEAGVATVLLRSPTPLRHLAVSPGFLFSTTAGALAIAPKAGGGMLRTLGIDQKTLTADETYAFYTFSGSEVFRADPASTQARVIGGLAAPRSFATDSTNLFAVTTDGTGNAIMKIDKLAMSVPASAATLVTRIAAGPTFLAVDSLGVVWGNADDGKIQRVSRSGDVTEVAHGARALNALVADGDGVYWTTDEGVVGWAVRP